MSLYRFQVCVPDVSVAPIDVNLPDDRAAWSQAVRAMGDLLQDAGDHLLDENAVVMSVSDEAERTVFVLKFGARRGDGL